MNPMHENDSGEFTIHLRCGTLRLRVDETALPLDELCTFGSRRNRQRGFLFISKVLGKHVPVRPTRMTGIHHLLAERIGDVAGPALFVALAETATGLGQGVFESWLEKVSRRDALFIHSTRYRLARPVSLEFRESHSHATEHLVYLPETVAALNSAPRTLVLIDDELTTGRTLVHLASEMLGRFPSIKSIRFVSITDWLPPGRRAEIAGSLGREVRFHQVLRGQFHFVADEAFEPGSIPNVVGRGDCKDEILTGNHGRLGVVEPLYLDLDRLIAEGGLRSGERILVLGSGEFAHPPFLLARRLEELGWDVHFQSTTRSPVLPGEGIASALEFVDNYHDEMPNFVYNVVDKKYDRILIGYETRPLPASHRLPELLGATPLFF